MASEKKDLSAKEVCEIIETCAKNGITSLQWGALTISRDDQTPGKEGPPPSGETAPPLNPQQIEQNARDAMEGEEVRLRRDEVDSLIINDPTRFEELLQEEELEDVDDESDDRNESRE